MPDFLEAFNEQTEGMEASCSQYLYDDGKICRRGLCCGGIHLWENLPSKGAEHFITGRIPVGEHKLKDGLYVGNKYRDQDDLKLAMITPEKLHKHWDLCNQESSLDVLMMNHIAWERRVVIAEASVQGMWAADQPFAGSQFCLKKISKEDIEPAAFDSGRNVIQFFFKLGVAYMVQGARSYNIIKINDRLTVLAFDGCAYGGIVAAWKATTDTPEGISIDGAEYSLLKTQIERKEKKMKINLDNEVKKAVEIPAVPKAAKTAEKEPETTNPRVEPEAVKKPDVVKEPKKAAEVNPQTTDAGIHNYAVNPAEEKTPFDEPLPTTIDGEFEDGLRQLAELFTNPFEQVPKDIKAVVKHFTALRKRVAKEMKNSADSAELKTLKAENKDLQKRVAALQAAVKSQAELLQKQL